MARRGVCWTLVVGILWVVGAASSLQAGYVSWHFNYTDSAGTGFNDSALGAARQNALNTAANIISSYVFTSGAWDVTVNVDVDSYVQSGGSLASAGNSFNALSNTFNTNLSQDAIQRNVNLGGDSAFSLSWNFAYQWGYSTVSGSEYDFVAVALHEMMHGLGIDGFISSNGFSESSTGVNVYGVFDRFVQGYNGSNYVPLINTDANGNPTGPITGAALALRDTNHPLHFNGPNAMAANGGNPVELVTLNPFNSGSSIYHLNFVNDLMYWNTGRGPQSHNLSALDLGVLQDLGYSMVPEPGSGVILIIAAPFAVWFVRRRNRLAA